MGQSNADASPVPPHSIDAIIQRCLNGDQAAWSEIVRHYWRTVFNVAYKFVGRHDQAEDLAQDVFLKLFKSLDTFGCRANFPTWLISVSSNLCIDHYRSVRREREAIARDVDLPDLSPAAPTGSPHADLERRDRVQEIADRLRLPEGAVKSRINRGRTEIARYVQKMREQQDAVPRTGVQG